MAVIKYKNGSNWVNAALAFYPVGAIYLSYSSVTPADLFGGTWSSITTGVLRAKGANSTGGADTHTLTNAQLPSLEGKMSFHGPTSRGSQLNNATGICSPDTKVANQYLAGGTTSGAASYGVVYIKIGGGKLTTTFLPIRMYTLIEELLKGWVV